MIDKLAQGSLVPFAAAFGASAVMFFLLDLIMMHLQGLSLFFHH